MTAIIRYFFLLLLVCRPDFRAEAQRRELFLKHFTADQGLPSNEMYQMLEDNRGYLWGVTDRGIVRYDGYQFEEMPIEGMSIVYPWFGVYNDSASGKIYFLGLKGQIAVYEKERLKAYPYNHKIGALHTKSDYTINSFYARNDSLWIGINIIGFYLITPEGVVIPQQIGDGIHFDMISGVTMRYLPHTPPGKPIPVYLNWGGYQIVDTVRSVLFWKYFRYKLAGYDLLFIGNQLLVYQGKKKQGVYTFPDCMLTVCILNESEILIGFQNRGVFLYRFADGKLSDTGEPWLERTSISDIHMDKQGGIWFSTGTDGVYYMYPGRVSMWRGDSKISTLSKYGNNLLAGYQSGTVHEIVGGKLKSAFKIPLPSNVYVAKYLVGSGDSVFAIANNNRVYGIADKKFFSAAALSDRMEKYDKYYRLTHGTLSDTLPGNILETIDEKRITCIFEHPEKVFWIGTFEGLYVYRNNTVHHYGNDESGSFFKTRIIGIGKLTDETLVIATLDNGVALCHNDGTVKILNKTNGLNATIINDMETDGGTIWLGTNKGISKIYPENQHVHVKNYRKSWGLPTIAINDLIVSGEWLYFKWNDKLIAIEKERLNNRLLPSCTPFITGVKVNSIPVDSAKPGEFRHDQNEVRITYNSVNLASGPYQVFQYRLQGADEKWHYTGERQAVFTNLAPGTYTFTVRVADAHGAFLPDEATYNFKILPAFWQQWWFLSAIGILLLLLAFLYYRSRLQVIKRNNKIMLDLAENQQKALVQQMSPHFIYNIVNTAQSAILHGQRMQAIEILSRFTRLMRLSLELSREKAVPLGREIQMLEKYLELETIRFPGKFTYSIRTEPAVDSQTIHIPSMLIQPFVENAIKHGISHLSGREGRIGLSFEKKGPLVLCTVSDNGIGRKRSTQINSNRTAYHQSAGMAITTHRLELLHKEKGLRSTYQIEDKYNENGEAQGTVVFFSIPYYT